MGRAAAGLELSQLGCLNAWYGLCFCASFEYYTVRKYAVLAPLC